ncbi:MAG: hypothetical protein EBV19_03910 [Flavobacteriia bacterium]|nr:hypothetical protein [Flavobacteriia bacterium]
MKSHSIFRAVIGLICCSTLLSCRTLNSNRILFYDKDSKTTFDTLPPVTHTQKIVPGDRLTIHFYPNEGESLLLAKTSSSEENVSINNTQEYEVNSKGAINFPMVGEFMDQRDYWSSPIPVQSSNHVSIYPWNLPRILAYC